MAGLVEVKFDKRKLAEVQRLLRSIPREMPGIMSRAINKTAAKAKTKIAKRITGEIKVKSAAVKKQIVFSRATRAFWQARLAIKGRAIPLIYFGARQTKTGVSYKAWSSGGRKVIKSAFIAAVSGGEGGAAAELAGRGAHEGVFKRVGKKRLPIKQLYGPAITDVLSTPQIMAQTLEETNRDLARQIDSQIKYVLEKRRTG